ncbi:unnamed protein product, partial [Mesorhabditis belari]|uniref:Pre-mRNA-splicing factor 38 n=1 Tax=Mesorhabditis belari TaxID=2138241 RepID=A0AAF3FEF8_9BILA
MANRTVKDASTVKGTNPQFLIEKIIRQRIYDSKFWKEECFALSAELLVDKGMELRYLGGIYAGNIKPTPFLCLVLKMLQLQPDREIVMEFIKQDEFKYIRALGALYLRMAFPSLDIYNYLEPLYSDFRKLRIMNHMGRFELMHMDDFIDMLLREERVFDIQMPRLQKRIALEEIAAIEEYKSPLDEDLGKVSESESDDDDKGTRKKERPSLISRRRSRSRERGERGERDRDDRKKSDKKERDRSRERDRDRRRRSKSRERDDKDRRDKDRERGREKDRGKRQSSLEREIDEANAQRKQLGLAPLQR